MSHLLPGGPHRRTGAHHPRRIPVSTSAPPTTRRWLVALAVAAIGCGGGSDPTAPPPRLVVTGLTAADTLDQAGATRTLLAWVVGSGGDRAVTAIWVSRDTLVARVTPVGVVTAQDDGATWVVASSPGSASDSVRAVVRRRAARLDVVPASASRPASWTQQFTAVARDAGGSLLGTGVAVAWISSRPDVASVDAATGLVTARSPGEAVIRATVGTGPGSATASAMLTVGAPLALRIEPTRVDVGVGQLSSAVLAPGPMLVADATDPEEDVTVTFHTADTGLVAAPAAVRLRANGRSQTNSPIVVTGRAVGVTRVLATAPGFAPAELWVSVTRPRLRLDLPDSADAVAHPDSVVRVRLATVTDVLRTVRRVAQRLPLTVTSSDPAVLEPVPADAADGWAVATGEAFAELRAAPRGAGTAWLRVAAPGYAPESVSVRVTAAHRLRFVDPVYRDVARTVIGARQSSGLEDAVLVDGADGGGPPYAVITLTQRHPERVRIAATLPVDLTSGRRTLRFAGLAVGVDTLVASAPGLLPDTLVVHVSTPRLIVRGRSGERTLPDSGRVTTPLAVSLFVGDSLGRAHFPLDGPVPLAATSSDAAVLRVGAAVTVGTSSGGSGDVWVRLLDVGTGTLTFSDPAGRLAPVTIPPVRVVATPLVVGAGTSPHAVVRVGMGQRLGDGHYLFGIPQNGSSFDTDLRARASDARLLPRVAVLAPVPNESGRRTVDVTAGDTTGAAWVILSAPGLLTDSVRVEVGRPRLGVLVDEPSSFDPRTPGDTVGVSVRVYDQGGGVRMTDRAVDLVLESSDPAVVRVVSPSLTAVAGSSGVRTRVVIVGPGAAVLRAREPGTSYARYEDGTSGPISVPPPTP